MIQNSNNILLISGSGRNVGKTSFIRRVIAHNVRHQMVAIKITPHFHEPTNGLCPIATTKNYRIFQETDSVSGKDSSVFLKAGAEKVFYLQTSDAYLEEAFLQTTVHISPEQPIVVESAALRKIRIPGLYLFIQKNHEEVKTSALEMQKLADAIVYSEGSQFSLNPESLIFDQTWKL
jgi:hypothetical protein